jgi:DnaJ-class molecular chaperone
LAAVSATKQPEADRTTCTPCRGTGSLISGKGGEPHTVSCPWCEGRGTFEAGHDAQAARLAEKPN